MSFVISASKYDIRDEIKPTDSGPDSATSMI